MEDASSELFGMGGSVYKSVETSLLAPLFREKTLGSPCRNGDAICRAAPQTQRETEVTGVSNLKSDSIEVLTKRRLKLRSLTRHAFLKVPIQLKNKTV